MAIRFGFLTDTHHYPDAPKDYGAPKMLTRSQEVLDIIPPSINTRHFDFVVHGGDFLCGGSSFDLPKNTFIRSIKEAADTFDQIRVPFYSVPGNHDCDAQTWSYDYFAGRFAVPSPLNIVQVTPQIRLALANVFHQVDVKKHGSGIWTQVLDHALREAADDAFANGCGIILVLHTWMLSANEDAQGLVENSHVLRQTIAECPSIAIVFTGHRHINRITCCNDYIVVDTACLIGYPLGFREVILSEDGYFTTHFHTLDLPDLLQNSKERSTPEQNSIWAGSRRDRDTKIYVPRLERIWS